jgi:hypothetical protein
MTDISLHEVGESSESSEHGLPKYAGSIKAKPGLTVEEMEASPRKDYEDVHEGEVQIVKDAKDLQTQLVDLEDDPTLNPWTFRSLFLGCGLAVFGAVLQEIFYFKPQVIFVSLVFLTVIGYVLGERAHGEKWRLDANKMIAEFMAFAIPKGGAVGRWLNPQPFNMKEHAVITLIASAASQSALSTQALAVQELYYGGYNKGSLRLT